MIYKVIKEFEIGGNHLPAGSLVLLEPNSEYIQKEYVIESVNIGVDSISPYDDLDLSNISAAVRSNIGSQEFLNDCCVLTACDSHFSGGLQILWASLADQCDFIVIDLGMTKPILDWCRERKISVIYPDLVVKRDIELWQKWNKPFFFKYMANRYVLWLDCDTMILRSIKPLFDYIRTRPLFTKDMGVIGFDLKRDQEIVRQWGDLTPNLSEKGILAKLNPEFHFIDGCGIGFKDRMGSIKDIPHIIRENPETVVHFSGAQKPDLIYDNVLIRPDSSSFQRIDREQKPLSIVSCCKNREHLLEQTLPTWIQLPVREIIIVDWSSNGDIQKIVNRNQNGLVWVIRVENEPYWEPSRPFNVGIKLASSQYVAKVDCDVKLSRKFLDIDFEPNTFYNSYGQINFGIVIFEKEAWKKINGYNENILCYGPDDRDFFRRLEEVGYVAKKKWNRNSIYHIKHSNQERISNLEKTFETVSEAYIEGGREMKNGSQYTMRTHWVKIYNPDGSVEEKIL